MTVWIYQKTAIHKAILKSRSWCREEESALQSFTIPIAKPEELSPDDAFVQSIHASVEKLRVWLLNLDPSLLALIDRKLHPIYEKKNENTEHR